MVLVVVVEDALRVQVRRGELQHGHHVAAPHQRHHHRGDGVLRVLLLLQLRQHCSEEISSVRYEKSDNKQEIEFSTDSDSILSAVLIQTTHR